MGQTEKFKKPSKIAIPWPGFLQFLYEVLFILAQVEPFTSLYGDPSQEDFPFLNRSQEAMAKSRAQARAQGQGPNKGQEFRTKLGSMPESQGQSRAMAQDQGPKPKSGPKLGPKSSSLYHHEFHIDL